MQVQKSVRVTAETHKLLKQIAVEEETSTAEFIRKLVDLYIQSQEGAAKQQKDKAKRDILDRLAALRLRGGF